MEALSPYRGRIVYGLGALLALAGCDSRHAEEAALDVAVVTARPSARMSSPATIARSTPRPTPTATPSPVPRTVAVTVTGGKHVLYGGYVGLGYDGSYFPPIDVAEYIWENIFNL